MPEKKTHGVCIICGGSSPTVVCMKCFFNYDYRTYNDKELERPMEDMLLYPPKDEGLLAEQDDWMMELDKKENDDTKSTSWFSRLPRFS